MTWTEPINGWDLLLNVIISLASVVVGALLALGIERRRVTAAANEVDYQVALRNNVFLTTSNILFHADQAATRDTPDWTPAQTVDWAIARLETSQMKSPSEYRPLMIEALAETRSARTGLTVADPETRKRAWAVYVSTLRRIWRDVPEGDPSWTAWPKLRRVRAPSK